MVVVIVLIRLLYLLESLVEPGGLGVNPSVELAHTQLSSQDLPKVYFAFEFLCFGELNRKNITFLFLVMNSAMRWGTSIVFSVVSSMNLSTVSEWVCSMVFSCFSKYSISIQRLNSRMVKSSVLLLVVV